MDPRDGFEFPVWCIPSQVRDDDLLRDCSIRDALVSESAKSRIFLRRVEPIREMDLVRAESLSFVADRAIRIGLAASLDHANRVENGSRVRAFRRRDEEKSREED